MASRKKRSRRVSVVNNRRKNSGTPSSNPKSPCEDLASAELEIEPSSGSKDETGLLRFIQTPDWSDVNFTATRIDTTAATASASKSPAKHVSESASRVNVKEPATKPTIDPNVESTQADDDSVVADDDSSPKRDPKKKKHVQASSNIELLMDKCNKDHKAFVTLSCLTKEALDRLEVFKNTVEKQKKDLKSCEDKLSSSEVHILELEAEVASLKATLSNVRIQRAHEVQELNAKVGRLESTLKAKDEQLSAKEEAWTSEKRVMMSTIESLRNLVQQLEGEKSSVADDRRWLIREGFKHVVNKLWASEEVLKPVGEVNTRASHVGFQEGLKAVYHFFKLGVSMENTPCYDPDVSNKLVRATRDFEATRFTYLEKLAACADAPIELLKSVEPFTSQASTT